MGGTIRTFRRETRAYIEKRLKELCKGIADAHGAEIKIDFDLVNKYPPTINSKEETKFAANVATFAANFVSSLELIVGGYLFTKSKSIFISAPCASAIPLHNSFNLFSIYALVSLRKVLMVPPILT